MSRRSPRDLLREPLARLAGLRDRLRGAPKAIAPPPWIAHGVPVSTVSAAELAPELVERARFLDAPTPARLQLGEHVIHPLQPTLVRSLCHPSGAPIPCLAHDDYVSEPPTYLRLRDALVHPRWGLVQTEPGRFVAESVHATTWLSPRLSGLTRDPTVDGGHLPYVWANGDLDVCRPEPPDVVLGGTHLLLGHWAAHNYGHFCMDCLPAPFVFRDELRSGRMSLLCRPLNRFQLELLERLGVDRAVHVVEEDWVRVRDLVIPLSLTCCYTAKPAPLHRELFSALRGEPSPDAPRRIYVSRASRVGSRVMLNESELWGQLEARGFVAIDPGQFSVGEQAARFSRAEIIVGAIGAGMTNIGYAPAGCAIVEILPETVAETWVAYLSQVLGHRFVYVLARTHQARETVLGGVARTDVAFDYDAPVAPTLAAVDHFIARRAERC